MTFSRRTSISRLQPIPQEAPNALSRAVTEARRRVRSDGRRWLDLTVSNPTTAGLPYETEAISSALAAPRALVYEPEALGRNSARENVAREYAASGITIDPSCIAITSSTSEAYAVLFKMLCDPGDEVLVPVPSYPLLAWLAAFEGVELRTYPLEYTGAWNVDLGALARAVGPRTRLIVVVNPNNPTGSFLGRGELDAMLDLGVPIVSDEVFATYPLGASGKVPEHRVDSALRADRGLVFVLSGLSKLVGLPQMKLGWIACGGDGARVRDAMERLETVLDAYLSVGAPVQHALPELLRAGKTTSDAIRSRTRANLAVVRARAREAPTMSVLDVEGGWYATLRVPDTRSDEEWALALVEEEGVYVHPGYFFDMTRGAHLVVSLLTPEADLAVGMDRIVARVSRDT
ncbi:MAG TPA: pyridoxal phosphate-dependent aminotransferase [Labilithrix sp.]|nr:pyridoxal phosphate-dependent aminotransferase [Labilithrix sp.]